ncbi:MAG TPA: hypothetical protein DIW23_01310 [Anaerolineae bacterium]|nr:hypothetical protein [Anaerolineae bacterium]
MNLLIPYIKLTPPDPTLSEFTYGDVNKRAQKLKNDLKPGDYVFFHTSWGGKKYITAYFVVHSVLDTKIACEDKSISKKYKNPHILDYLEKGSQFDEDAILFGDPIKSRVLDKPLLFDKELAKKLSLDIEFSDKFSDAQIIGSAARQWRQITDKDVDILLRSIDKNKKYHRLRTTEEVSEVIEKDIEEYLASNPSLIGKGLKLIEKQLPIESGRIDLLFEDKKGNLILVEVKLNRIGRDAIHQIQKYINELKSKNKGKKVSGVIVCSGVMLAYENDIRKQKDIQIFIYGWNMKVLEW